MEDKARKSETKQDSPAEFVSVCMSESVPVVDSVECGCNMSHQSQSAVSISPRDPTWTKESNSVMHRPIQASEAGTMSRMLSVGINILSEWALSLITGSGRHQTCITTTDVSVCLVFIYAI